MRNQLQAEHPLRRWLRETGTTQAKLAKDVGTHQPHISAYLSGAEGFSYKLATEIAAQTGGKVTVEDLMTRPVRRKGERKKRRQPEAA